MSIDAVPFQSHANSSTFSFKISKYCLFQKTSPVFVSHFSVHFRNILTLTKLVSSKFWGFGTDNCGTVKFLIITKNMTNNVSQFFALDDKSGANFRFVGQTLRSLQISSKNLKMEAFSSQSKHENL